MDDADAVHPGYGFLSENARFADILEEHEIAFIRPKPEHIRLMGDKSRRSGRRSASASLRPGLGRRGGGPGRSPGSPTRSAYPVIIKAAAGGGGRGMRVANTPDELANALERRA